MISRLFISPDQDSQRAAAEKALSVLELSRNHPDVLWIEPGDKSLGVEDTKKIREHFSFKPFLSDGRAVVVIGAEKLTQDSQHSLLKTLEEPPESAAFVLAASREDSLLPTILSRCEIVLLNPEGKPSESSTSDNSMDELFNSSIEKKFQVIEKTENREDLLNQLSGYIHRKLPEHPELVDFAKLILEAQEWHNSQGNIRTILEYLALNMPINP